MPPRTAFTQSDLDHHGHLTVRGVSEPLPDAELVLRHIAFEQGGEIVHSAPSESAKDWSTVLEAPTFVAGDAYAIGIETYLIAHDSLPVFTTFTWSESREIRQT